MPTSASGVVYLGTGTSVYSFDAASGRPLRRFDTTSNISADAVFSTPIVASNTLYAATAEGMVCAFAL